MTAIRVPIPEYKQLCCQAQRAAELEEINARLKRENELLKELLQRERVKNYEGREILLLNEEEPGVSEIEIKPSRPEKEDGV